MDTATHILNIERQLKSLFELIENHKTLIKETGFYRIEGVMEIIPISESAWYDGVRKGRFPKPKKMRGVSFWVKRDIIELVNKIEKGEAV